ncbi:MAG: zinc ribbon domain-containing protein [Ruminococcaceae bacterium]|nr:zinc ribbon domain-containing protein [Oscillospiraceae bacterium]
MEKFLSDLKQTMSSAFKKSGELVELTKIKLAAGDTKNSIQKNFIKLGELTYLTSKGDENSGSEIKQLISTIDNLMDTLSQQEEKMVELSNKKVCSACGKASAEEAAFCSSCGNPF